MSSATLDIRPFDLPASIDDHDAATYLEFVAASNAVWRHDSGTGLFDEDAAEWLIGLHDVKYVEKTGVVARRGDEILGFATLASPRATERTANVDIVVRPGLREHGIEDALLDAIEVVAREQGRSVLHAFAFTTADAGGERLVAPTGFGSVPRDSGTTRFLLRNDFTLGQVERVSTFDLHGSYAENDRLLEAAMAHAGPDYRPVWWQIPTPPEYADGYAAAISRMETDVPSGELEWEEDPWDAQRVADRDARKLEAGQVMAVTAVVHEPTGVIAAFNELAVGGDRTRPTVNYGTLVMPEHRGRRLGTIVKCLGLRRWHDLVPESPLVQTFNAEENRFMLDVNEAVGFSPVAYSGEWKKELR